MNDAQPSHFFERFCVDARRRLLLRSTGEVIPLSPKVFDTLLCFLEHPGELIDKRTLMRTVWPDVVVEENNLNQCISALRRVLGERPEDHRFIVTVPGRGYRFVARVTSAPDQPSEGVVHSARPAQLSVPAVAATPRRRSGLYIALGVTAAGLAGLLLLPGERAAVAPIIEDRPAVSLEAQRAYHQARTAVEGGQRQEALALLEEATRLEPDFAAAHAQLALLYARSFIDWASESALPIDATELRGRVIAHAGRALDLDENQTEAHVALGELHTYSWRWCDAESAFASAYRLGPSTPDALLYYSQFKAFVGEYAAAESLGQRFFEVVPLSPAPHAVSSGSIYALWLAKVYSGDLDEALRYLNEHLAVQPRQMVAHLNLGYVQVRLGDRAAAAAAFRAVEALRGSMDQPALATNLAYGYSRIGHRAEAERLLVAVGTVDADRMSAGTATIANLALGNETGALATLEKALRKIEAREPDAGWFSLMIIKHNLTGDPLLEKEPFAALRARIHGRGPAGRCDAQRN